MKGKREREEPCHICGHYHDYEGGEPCSVCGHRLAPPAISSQRASAFPSAVLPSFLYLGSYDHASRSDALKMLEITHILNTVPSCQTLYKNSFEYHTVATAPPDFDECCSFIEKVRSEEGKRVLVHCMTGISRSPAVVVAYLMKQRRWRLTEAYKWVKEHRPETELTSGEATRLQQYELQVLGSSSTGYQPSAAPSHSSASSGGSGDLQFPAQQPGFNWGWRDAPAPSQPKLLPVPVESINFAQQHAGSFVFGGGSEPSSNGGGAGSATMAMES
ncbi:g10621 [Coccomyxa viridis]|uniref:G10621 protein n=1 Tax=Coccomyxa viridis TaxID=1274662 RepID=A0ABP1GBS8_9CHLO